MLQAQGRNTILRRRISSRWRLASTNHYRFSSSTTQDDNDIDSAPLLKSLDDNGVLTLTLNRPQHRNALNRELLENLHTSITSADSDSDTKVIILQSHGYVFSSGHDLKELASLVKDDNQTAIKELFELCTETMMAFSKIRPPTLCAVEGLATAAGCQLVASCDVVVASSLASFQTPGAMLGLFCHTPAVPLARCIGSKQCLDMLYTGKEMSANEAFMHGMVSRLAKDAQKEALKMATAMATESSAATLQMGKSVFFQQNGVTDMEDAYELATQAMIKNMELYDAKHGIDSFLQKRKPDFQDK